MPEKPTLHLPQADLRRLADNALTEDRAWHDVTTTALVPPDQKGRAGIIAREEGVLAGLLVAHAVFDALDSALLWQPRAEDGARLSPGQVVATIEGPLAALLRGERVALNYLSHLSGVATATARLVEAIAGLPVRIRDTRKTIPGLRMLEKYAVSVGGGENHRLTLADAVLIKDNHLAALRARELGIAEAVRLARQEAPEGIRVQIELTTVEEARQALDAGAEELLLDNMSPSHMRQVVELANALPARGQARPTLEASGRITLQNVRDVAESGVDYISVGAITHSAKALDISLEVEAT